MVDPQQIGMNILGAFQMGRQERERQDYRTAVGDYATNPTGEGLNALARYAPEFVLEERGRLQQQEQQQRQADLQRRAASGDPTALGELAGIDIDAWGKLNTAERQQHEQRVKVIGQAALAVSQLPPEQRPAAWDSYIGQLSQQYPELAEYRGQYSEQALMGAIAQSEQMGKFFELSRPSYQVIPEGGVMVNTRDPSAVQQYAGGNIPPPATLPPDFDFGNGGPGGSPSGAGFLR
jgi:hypothetical protein